jgi:hypothetical protein
MKSFGCSTLSTQIGKGELALKVIARRIRILRSVSSTNECNVTLVRDITGRDEPNPNLVSP